MARSAEKAMAILSRWTTMMNNEDKPSKNIRRPFLATECTNLRAAEKWRRQVIREISKKVAQIQNAGMGEFRIRDLNDEINKLLREKKHWEDQILVLDGPNYAKIGPKMLDVDGKELPGNRGYKYFGAARELPGVKELLAQEPPKAQRKNRAELYKFVDADYYGYRDDDDGVLIPLEKEAEESARQNAIAEFKRKCESKEIVVEEEEENRYSTINEDDVDDDDGNEGFVSHVSVPSQKDVEEMLVKRKKQELLDRYASDILKAQSTEAKTLMGL